MKRARKRWATCHERHWRRECVVGVVWDVVLFAAIVVALLAFCGVVRGQCYIDPNTGQRVCTNGGGDWVSVTSVEQLRAFCDPNRVVLVPAYTTVTVLGIPILFW